MRKHYLSREIASRQEKISVDIVGAGGTGSHMLTNLAMISKSLVDLGSKPLFVRVWDFDNVEEHNVGRQQFSPADVGRNKAEILVTRLNRYYGLDWAAIPKSFDPHNKNAHILISCVDSVKSRRTINYLSSNKKSIYWMDIGNSRVSGQIILGTLGKVYQPERYTRANLPTFFDEFPNPEDDPNEPSCSAAQSLQSQDLFINKIMATYASQMLWDLLKNYYINYRAVYVNLDAGKISKVFL
jgi:PRTRC genetic system ThiF family protein